MNKNISVWRGSKTPPTNYHVWINEENDILLHDGTEWKTIVDDNNYEDLRQHLIHFPKMDVINNIPIINTELLENEFSIYRLTRDVEVTSEYEKFDKTEPFVAKKGDLYIQCKIPTPNEFIPEAVSPIVTIQDAINENRPIVLKLSSKDADVELDIMGGVLKTVRRQLTPTWIISGTPSNAYIKHIKTNQYLNWNGSNYVLTAQNDTKFQFSSLGNNGGYEISRVGSSQALNPFQYTKPGVEIKEYNKGDSKNELVIIDPTLYELPVISSETVKTDFIRGEGFPYSLNFTTNNSYYINSSDGVKVSDTPMKYLLCGTYEKLALVTSNNKVLIINNGHTIGVSDSSRKDFCLVPHGHTSNKSFAICSVSNPDKAFNANAGIILGHNIVIWDTWDSNNGITFVPYASVMHKHIPLSNATNSYSGLMSKEDKAKLDSFQDSSKYKITQTAKSSPNASGTSIEFIDTISQNAQGVITATKKSVRDASQSQSGLMSSSDKTKLDNLIGITWSILSPDIFGEIAYYTNNTIKFIPLSKWDNSLGEPIGIALKKLEDNKVLIMSMDSTYDTGPVYSDTQSSLQNAGQQNSHGLQMYSSSNSWVYKLEYDQLWYLPSIEEASCITNMDLINEILSYFNKPTITSLWSSTIECYYANQYKIAVFIGNQDYDWVSGFNVNSVQHHRVLFTTV